MNSFIIFLPFLNVIFFHSFYVDCIEEVAFVILSQTNIFHYKASEKLRENILNQFENLKKDLPLIYSTSNDFPHIGSWTIFPVLFTINSMLPSNIKWLIFLEDRTRVQLEILIKVLKKYDHNQKIWIGKGIFDEDATIIHHFAFHENPRTFLYPNILSGFAMSAAMVRSLEEDLKNQTRLPDFSIDNSHELALFIWNNGNGQSLSDEPLFCVKHSPECATYVKHYTDVATPIPNETILFAVKTCGKFHEDRVSFVKRTWGKAATNIKYFSDIEDRSIPTIGLGVPNTEQGHCAKTMAILKYVKEKFLGNMSWIALTDDDTILSVFRLQKILSRYNSSKDVAVGERYGYNVAYTPPRGYNYITGGGGIVFSSPLVHKLVKYCKCPAPNSPDDMILGMCLNSLGIEITHSSAFHQARPLDYSAFNLQNEKPVSFHKHWMIDPKKVYEEWFGDESPNSDNLDFHLEL